MSHPPSGLGQTKTEGGRSFCSSPEQSSLRFCIEIGLLDLHLDLFRCILLSFRCLFLVFRCLFLTLRHLFDLQILLSDLEITPHDL